MGALCIRTAYGAAPCHTVCDTHAHARSHHRIALGSTTISRASAGSRDSLFTVSTPAPRLRAHWDLGDLRLGNRCAGRLGPPHATAERRERRLTDHDRVDGCHLGDVLWQSHCSPGRARPHAVRDQGRHHLDLPLVDARLDGARTDLGVREALRLLPAGALYPAPAPQHP